MSTKTPRKKKPRKRKADSEPKGRNKYLPRRLREPLVAIIDRFRNGERAIDVGELPRDVTRDITRLQRRLAIDYLKEEGVMRGEIARLFGIDRKTVYDDIKWLQEIRRRELEPSVVVDYWLAGIKAMDGAIETAERMKLEHEDDPETLAEWTRIQASAGRDLAAEMRQMGTSQAMISLLKEGKGSLGDGFPQPSDTINFLDHIYRTRVLKIEDKREQQEEKP